MTGPALPAIHQQSVLTEWIDYNNHMNVAFYVLIFDQSLDVFLDEIGLTREYRESANCTVYVLETHVTYLQEVHEGDPLEMTVRVIDCDEKRMHLFLEMYHRDKGYLAATSEQMIMHLDKTGPSAAPMPAAMQAALEANKALYKETPAPKQSGNVIGIRRKK
ncbi:thioesterase family protein [Sneathiella marina]|uniref:Thioesterase family protein n=1 Tax=Sneathiella marina TaxID=2950108 RepID=A0ABY4W0B2_9PROT|nr:thioesterase family protein [Sneathiella marina]USG60621.1 thioesterase family protein [Sneathiella marina]